MSRGAVRNRRERGSVFTAESGSGREGGDNHVKERQDRRRGVAVGLVMFFLLPWWAALLIILGVPAAAYLTLDPAQRRRLRRVSRKELGR
ncbi:hypothetical protein SHKM778_58890 [Streptomyces sp. KM77-8]|uniref:Integral membrane protein n=1 Tax=Streptomyces haneummycinicus TaxID=3074435 RepID=A0AAT9HPU5_9ACTN